IYRVSVQITNALGVPVTQTWFGGNGRVQLAGADSAVGGSVAIRSQGELGLPTSDLDHLGVRTQYAWDAARQLRTGTTEAAGLPEQRSVQTEWHPTMRLPVRITEPGRTTEIEYDVLGNVLRHTQIDLATGARRSRSWTYTPQGLVASMTDPLGRTWAYEYDASGNRIAEKNPLGEETRSTFDGAGRLLTQTLANGLVTRFDYDARGRLLSRTAAGEVTAYAYTATGRIASVTLPFGYRVAYSYDPNDRLVGAQDSAGATLAYTLDAAGHRIREEVRDASGAIARVTGSVIDALNRVSAVTGASGQATQLGYDLNGEWVAHTDPLNQTTRQNLDALRRVTATTFADNDSASQAWTPLESLTQVDDPKGVRTQYATNAFGEVTSETSSDIGTIRFDRDAAGDVIRTEDAKGQVTQIERDALGRETRIEYASDHAATLHYDASGAVSRVEDNSGVTVLERDLQGRVTVKTQDVHDNPASPSRFRIAYSYAGGELAGMVYPSGLKIASRRVDGRITGIDAQPPGGSLLKPAAVLPLVSDLAHTALGQPRAWRWFNGDIATRAFDADGRMTANEIASYVYDAAGRMTGITQQLWAADTAGARFTTPLTWQVGYDRRNRVTSFVRDGAQTTYSYDPNSNRLTAVDIVRGDTDLDGAYEASDFMLSTQRNLKLEGSSNRLLGFAQTVTRTEGATRKVATSQVSYAVDANGSLIADGLRDFDYDAANRLSKVRLTKDGEAASVSYLHNAFGQRVFKGEMRAEQTLPTADNLGDDFITWLKSRFGWLFKQAAANSSIGTAYMYGDGAIPSWAVVGSYDNGSATGVGRNEYIWLPVGEGHAIPVAVYRNGHFFAIHTDHLGTPRLMTNVEKTPVWQWPYSAFGDNKPTGILAATPNPQVALTNRPLLLKTTSPRQILDLAFPGQIRDDESGLKYNGN
ncbi:MAG: hypothetical protein AB7P99_21025, partial [Vicinamibacterales bacterium]